MDLKKLKSLVLKTIKTEKFFVFAVTFVSYLFFYYKLFIPGNFFWESDVRIEYLPARYYIHEIITQERRFPFWTERLYSGFPIYADLENSYLHVPNVLAILLFGPQASYKVLHLISHILGGFGLYYLLKKHKIGKLAFVVANPIYFYSGFLLAHQIHFGFVMSMYLMPLLLLMFEKFKETKRFKFIIFSALILANGFYWGHLQMTIIMGLGFFIYTLATFLNEIKLKTLLTYYAFVGFLTIAISLPQLYPTYVLGSRSIRAPGVISVYQGSYAPPMIFTNLYPSLFSTDTDPYKGREVKSDYSFVETSMYLGIVAVILAVFGSIFGKNKKLLVFSYALIFTYLLFGFSYFTPWFKLEHFPILNLFRYWIRTAILVSLALAVLSALFVDSIVKKELKISKLGIGLGAFTGLYFSVLYYINYNYPIVQHLYHKNIKRIPDDSNFTTWFYVVVMAFILIFLNIGLVIFKKSNKYSNKIFVILIFGLFVFDMVYHLHFIQNYNIKDISIIQKKRAKVPKELYNKRVIIKDKHLRGMESVYYKHWTPFGYSQLAESKYVDRLKRYGTMDVKDPKKIHLPPERAELFKRIGVSATILKGQLQYLDKDSQIDLLATKEQYKGKYLKKQEGHIIMEIESFYSRKYDTYIKNYPGWKLKINGKNQDFAKPLDEMFLAFKLERGKNTVELKYTPVDFYKALLVSTLLLVSLYKISKKNKSKEIYNKLCN